MNYIANISIGSYQLASSVNGYDQWQFEPDDRIIRCSQKYRRTQQTYGPPIVEPDLEVVNIEYVYSISADILRRRLGRAGFSRASLEKEFREWASSQVHRDAVSNAGLDEWLDALAKVTKAGLTPSQRSGQGFIQTVGLLVDIIMGQGQQKIGRTVAPQHDVDGFPCSTLNNMAVALLEVTPGKALCELDVTQLVLHRGDTTFDDMLGRGDEL